MIKDIKSGINDILIGDTVKVSCLHIVITCKYGKSFHPNIFIINPVIPLSTSCPKLFHTNQCTVGNINNINRLYHHQRTDSYSVT
ncbi:MAG: hypothetical protein ACTTJH_01960 [Bacteroidales bacterium]